MSVDETGDAPRPHKLAEVFGAVTAEEREERSRAALAHTAIGRARTAHARGDRVFQYSQKVVGEEAEYPMTILNGVCAEGWDLVSGQFVFMGRERGTVGYYLFRRRRE